MFVIYEGFNGEILVTTKEKEAEFLAEYGIDRNFEDDYDREEMDQSGIAITIRGFRVL